MDPLKATHTVQVGCKYQTAVVLIVRNLCIVLFYSIYNILFLYQGVTGREMAHYFFDKDVRMDWDSKLSCRLVKCT